MKFWLFLLLIFFCTNIKVSAQDMSHSEYILHESNQLIFNGEYERAENILLKEIEELENHQMEDQPIFRRLLVEFSYLSNQLHNYMRAYAYASYAKILYEKNQDFQSDYIRCLTTFAEVLFYYDDKIWSKFHIDTAINMARKEWKENLDRLGETEESYYVCDNFISMLTSASLIYANAGCEAEAIAAIKEAVDYVEKTDNDISYPYFQLGQLYFKKKEYTQAIEVTPRSWTG